MIEEADLDLKSCDLIDVTFILHALRLTKLQLYDDRFSSNADIDEDKAVDFDPETHHNFCVQDLNHVVVDFKLWVECQTVNREAANERLGRMFNFPTTTCYNHAL